MPKPLNPEYMCIYTFRLAAIAIPLSPAAHSQLLLIYGRYQIVYRRDY